MYKNWELNCVKCAIPGERVNELILFQDQNQEDQNQTHLKIWEFSWASTSETHLPPTGTRLDSEPCSLSVVLNPAKDVCVTHNHQYKNEIDFGLLIEFSLNASQVRNDREAQ